MSDTTALSQGFHGGLGSSRADTTARVKTYGQMSSVRHCILQSRCDAVGWNDVKANTGADNNSGLPGSCVQGVCSFKDCDLTGNVEVMDAGLKARPHHRIGSCGKRARAMQDETVTAQRTNNRIVIVERERNRRQFQYSPKCVDTVDVAPGQHCVKAARFRTLGNQSAGVAIGTVDQPTHDRIKPRTDGVRPLADRP